MKTEKEIKTLIESLQEHKKSFLQLMMVTDSQKLTVDYEKVCSSIKALQWVIKVDR